MSISFPIRLLLIFYIILQYALHVVFPRIPPAVLTSHIRFSDSFPIRFLFPPLPRDEIFTYIHAHALHVHVHGEN